MGIDQLNFSDLNLTAIGASLVLLGAIDTIGSVIIAVGAKTFNGEYLMGFLISHVQRVWFPIFALGLIGVGIPALSIPAIPAASLAATGALAAYAVATIASLRGSFGDQSAVPAA